MKGRHELQRHLKGTRVFSFAKNPLESQVEHSGTTLWPLCLASQTYTSAELASSPDVILWL